MKTLVDFKELAKIVEDDPSKMYIENPLEFTFLNIDGEEKHISELSTPEILNWFNVRFPWLQIRLKNMPENPSPLVKSALFNQLVGAIGGYWAKVRARSNITGGHDEFGEEDERGERLH